MLLKIAFASKDSKGNILFTAQPCLDLTEMKKWLPWAQYKPRNVTTKPALNEQTKKMPKSNEFKCGPCNELIGSRFDLI